MTPQTLISQTKRYVAQIPKPTGRNAGGSVFMSAALATLGYDIMDTIGDMHDWHGEYGMTPAMVAAIGRKVIAFGLAVAGSGMFQRKRKPWTSAQRQRTVGKGVEHGLQ